MTRSTAIGNRLLAALPASDFDLLKPELEVIALDQDAVIARTGDAIEYVFFPYSGAISLMIQPAPRPSIWRSSAPTSRASSTSRQSEPVSNPMCLNAHRSQVFHTIRPWTRPEVAVKIRCPCVSDT